MKGEGEPGRRRGVLEVSRLGEGRTGRQERRAGARQQGDGERSSSEDGNVRRGVGCVAAWGGWSGTCDGSWASRGEVRDRKKKIQGARGADMTVSEGGERHLCYIQYFLIKFGHGNRDCRSC